MKRIEIKIRQHGLASQFLAGATINQLLKEFWIDDYQTMEPASRVDAITADIVAGLRAIIDGYRRRLQAARMAGVAIETRRDAS